MPNERDRQVQSVPDTRPVALQRLYKAAFSELWNAAASGSKSYPGDPDGLVSAVARLVDQYPGPLDDAPAFAQWAITEIIQPSLARLEAFYAIREENRGTVRKAILSVLQKCDDLGVTLPGNEEGSGIGSLGTVGELEAEVWLKVFLDLDKWLTPGYSTHPGHSSAQLSTRLFAFARSQALGWRTSRLRERNKGNIEISDLIQWEEKNTRSFSGEPISAFSAVCS